MRLYELISEQKTTKVSKDLENVSHGIYRARDTGGYDRTYHMNRIMMAMAKADGKSCDPVDSPADTWFEKYNTMHPYTKEEDNMVQAAMKSVPTDGRNVVPYSKSMENDDVNKYSPVPHNSGNRKKNK